jgi:hypothetical protein
MFAGLYKKPAFILSTLLGLYYATTVILNYFKVIDWYHETPIFEIACGIFLLLAATRRIYLQERQRLLANCSSFLQLPAMPI